MTLAEKITEYTKNGQSPGVTELIELREIARNEGLSYTNLDQMIQQSIESLKKNSENLNTDSTLDSYSFEIEKERTSFEKELEERAKQAEDLLKSEYTFVPSTEIEIENSAEPFQSFEAKITDIEINTSEEIIEEIQPVELTQPTEPIQTIEETLKEYKDKNQQSKETNDKENSIDELVYSINKANAKNNNKPDPKLTSERSNFLLEKEAEWQAMHGKKNSFSTTKKTHKKSSKVSVDAEAEVKKVYNLSIVSLIVSFVFGFIGLFFSMYTLQRVEKLKNSVIVDYHKGETGKKLRLAKNLTIGALIISGFSFLMKFILFRI